MAHLMRSVPDRPSGWTCPECGSIYAPWVASCTTCRAPFLMRPVTAEAFLQPCRPPREGGMCGCGEPDDDRAVTAARDLPGLPADGTWTVAADWDWGEICPGLQCRVRNLSVTRRPLDAPPFAPPPFTLILEFRRLDGQDHD